MMFAIDPQCDLVATFKMETCSNLSILNKIYLMDHDLARQIFREEALHNPTQRVFIHLSYYLLCIIDAQRAAKITWPVFDPKSKKTYITEFSRIITEYSKQGLLSPVMSSYFVNPGCDKVTKLMSQLSQLAVQKTLHLKMKTDYHKTLYKAASDKYKCENEDFSEFVDHETDQMMSKFNKYLLKKNYMIQISAKLKKSINDIEERLSSVKKNEFVNKCIDDFLGKHDYDEKTRYEVETIKRINKPVPILDAWLDYVDKEITKSEFEWNSRFSPFLESSKICQESAKTLVLRHFGEIDKKSYTVEYDPKSDQIATKNLEMHVNSQQQYILKNIIKDGKLNFPNLIRGYLIAKCYILKNLEMRDIYKLNEHLESGSRKLRELGTKFENLIERVNKAEARLQISPVNVFNQSIPQELAELPPLPSLSDLKFNWSSNEAILDTFTPLKYTSHDFNFRHKSSICTFIKPQPKPTYKVTPFDHPPETDFLRGLKSINQPNRNMSQNISIISQPNSQSIETFAELSLELTKQQIQRLSSTKTSSLKKHKFNSKRPNIDVKKGGLFNETIDSGLKRSHSSPNLFESEEKKCRGRMLSIMQEDTLSPEFSGIAVLDCSKPGISQRSVPSGSLRKLLDSINMPTVIITPVEYLEMSHSLKETENPGNAVKTDILKEKPTRLKEKETSSNTPNNNVHHIKKTSSIEKIINRYKKVRARNVFPTEAKEDNQKGF